MTTSVLHIDKFSVAKIIVQFHLWLQNCFYSTSYSNLSAEVVVSVGILYSFSVLLEMAFA